MIQEGSPNKNLSKVEISAGRKRLKQLNEEWLKQGERARSDESIVESIGTFSSSSLETLPPRYPNPVYSTDSEDDDFEMHKKPLKRKPKQRSARVMVQQTEEEPSTGSIGDLMSLGLLAPDLPEIESKTSLTVVAANHSNQISARRQTSRSSASEADSSYSEPSGDCAGGKRGLKAARRAGKDIKPPLKSKRTKDDAELRKHPTTKDTGRFGKDLIGSIRPCLGKR